VSAGVIRFLADNIGEETHELAILKDGEEIAEVEDVGKGSLKSLKVRLEPGKYELACLIDEDGEDHYQNGMHVDFEVK
jgi:uncharacterized cupredoxin-like copper-binding protein